MRSVVTVTCDPLKRYSANGFPVLGRPEKDKTSDLTQKEGMHRWERGVWR